MQVLDQAGDGALMIPNTAALIKNGPHPEAARRLMRFLLSEQLEQLLVQSDSHNGPIHASVAQSHPQYTIENALAVDYGRVADYLPTAIETAGKMLP